MEPIQADTPLKLLEKARFAHIAGDQARKEGDSYRAREMLGAAEDAYNRVLNVHPDNGLVLQLLGMMDQQKGNNGRAIALTFASISHLTKEYKNQPDPGLAEFIAFSYATQGYALRAEGRREGSESCFHQAVDWAPENPEILAGFSGLYINDGNPQKCIDLIKRADKIQPGMADQENWNLSLAHLELGHWVEGFKRYHDGLMNKSRLNKNYWEEGRTPYWDGTPNQTVVVYGEQGVGDEIMFASCLPELIRDCKKVIFDCHPRLEKTFKRSFPGIEIHGTRKTTLMPWACDRDDIDAQIAIGSLGMFYRKKDSDFPTYEKYLDADLRRVEHYRWKLNETGPGPYIGVAWSGGNKKTRFELRSIPLSMWKPILEQPATFISLHYMPEAAADAEAAGLPHWQEAITDLDEMHALIMACDLVITVNQSLVHQAGALGRVCWTLTPSRPAWRYGLKGSKMTWYKKSVRQFRQKGDDWQPAIDEVANELRGFIRKQKAVGVDLHSGPRAEPQGFAIGAAD